MKMGKNEHRSKAEDFEFEVSKLNFCRLIIAEEKITMITQRKCQHLLYLDAIMKMVNKIVEDRT